MAKPKPGKRIRNVYEREAQKPENQIHIPEVLKGLSKANREAIARGLNANIRKGLNLE